MPTALENYNRWHIPLSGLAAARSGGLDDDTRRRNRSSTPGLSPDGHGLGRSLQRVGALEEHRSILLSEKEGMSRPLLNLRTE